ncbi:hypothetical protein K504DRAFT_522030 [Pleomassaria siparia CBS 279.74]|uniref:Uncharacterized protein n=1 Tax=Pleomassaria siparia CBS 279.74 TaxID=1314801 RepID=A0A6G1KJQ7_9PLEO|nr:hypothetical protein K504DRAFT_522030 [Pleomassaria siparia CBS 279.74]
MLIHQTHTPAQIVDMTRATITTVFTSFRSATLLLVFFDQENESLRYRCLNPDDDNNNVKLVERFPDPVEAHVDSQPGGKELMQFLESMAIVLRLEWPDSNGLKRFKFTQALVGTTLEKYANSIGNLDDNVTGETLAVATGNVQSESNKKEHSFLSDSVDLYETVGGGGCLIGSEEDTIMYSPFDLDVEVIETENSSATDVAAPTRQRATMLLRQKLSHPWPYRISLIVE